MSTELLTLGQLTSPFGVQGWLKVFSYTDPITGILNYPEWIIEQGLEQRLVKLAQGRQQGKALVVQLVGVQDRTAAEALAGAWVKVPKAALPQLPHGDFYWWQLEGLRVETNSGIALGVVSHLLSTGAANDVLVVRATHPDDPQQERLLPWLMDQVIVQVDLDSGLIVVDWDPEF